MRLRSGDVCGNYVVRRLIGRGGMGEVYEASHSTLERRVALKVLNANIATDERSLARFFREARSAAHVRHPHIINVFDCGAERGLCYLVMEFIEGQTFAEYLSSRGPLTGAETAAVLLPVAEAVAALHAAKILHRDLKPSNVLLATDRPGGPWPIVTDFGVSRSECDPALTTSDALLGTPAYVSPEVLRTPRSADARSDQYALGVMLYESSTGRRPFAGNSPYALMHAIATNRVLPPSSHNGALTPAWDSLVLRAMSRDPADRFPSMPRLAKELSIFAADGSSAGAIAPVALTVAPGPWKALPGRLAVSLTTAAAISVIFIMSARKSAHSLLQAAAKSQSATDQLAVSASPVRETLAMDLAPAPTPPAVLPSTVVVASPPAARRERPHQARLANSVRSAHVEDAPILDLDP
jgi:serine/threonine protein kinase